jgi:hypothetical protein
LIKLPELHPAAGGDYKDIDAKHVAKGGLVDDHAILDWQDNRLLARTN